MYTALEEVKSEVSRRWNDKELKHRVEEYLGGDVPVIFKKEPRGALLRFIATPNYEMFNFARLSLSLNLSPVVTEYCSDKFFSVNPDKKYLGKIDIYRGEDPFTCTQRPEIKGYKILHFNKYEGKAIQSLNTVWGQSLVDFHHQLMDKELHDVEMYDLSAWIARHGGNPRTFYSRVLALFVCHGVQFENYHKEGSETLFTQDIVIPAIRAVTNHFGVKPLIVPAVPINSEHDPAWSWYASATECEVEHKMTSYYAIKSITT